MYLASASEPHPQDDQIRHTSNYHGWRRSFRDALYFHRDVERSIRKLPVLDLWAVAMDIGHAPQGGETVFHYSPRRRKGAARTPGHPSYREPGFSEVAGITDKRAAQLVRLLVASGAVDLVHPPTGNQCATYGLVMPYGGRLNVPALLTAAATEGIGTGRSRDTTKASAHRDAHAMLRAAGVPVENLSRGSSPRPPAGDRHDDPREERHDDPPGGRHDDRPSTTGSQERGMADVDTYGERPTRPQRRSARDVLTIAPTDADRAPIPKLYGAAVWEQMRSEMRSRTGS